MTKEIFYEATVNGETISLSVTSNNDIMIEASDDGHIDRATIEYAAHANGFNCCFQTRNKREFAESCHFNNILISKKEYDEKDGSCSCNVVAEFYLSELRKSPAKLRKFLEEE